jgi:hypothetical protein
MICSPPCSLSKDDDAVMTDAPAASAPQRTPSEVKPIVDAGTGVSLPTLLSAALQEECINSLRSAASTAPQSIIEEASDHPLVRGPGLGGRKMLVNPHGTGGLFVVFDTRCSLLAGESIRFYSDAGCLDLLASAQLDDRRKAYAPLLLPSPCWMQVESIQTRPLHAHHQTAAPVV